MPLRRASSSRWSSRSSSAGSSSSSSCRRDDLRLRSESNYVRTVRLEAPRGDILDREGRVLATTRPAFGLQVIPNDLRKRRGDAWRRARHAHRSRCPSRSARRGSAAPARARLRFQAVRLASETSPTTSSRAWNRTSTPSRRGDRRGGRDATTWAASSALAFAGLHRRDPAQSARDARLRRLPAGRGDRPGGHRDELLQPSCEVARAARNLVVDVAGGSSMSSTRSSPCPAAPSRSPSTSTSRRRPSWPSCPRAG